MASMIEGWIVVENDTAYTAPGPVTNIGYITSCAHIDNIDSNSPYYKHYEASRREFLKLAEKRTDELLRGQAFGL